MIGSISLIYPSRDPHLSLQAFRPLQIALEVEHGPVRGQSDHDFNALFLTTPCLRSPSIMSLFPGIVRTSAASACWDNFIYDVALQGTAGIDLLQR